MAFKCADSRPLEERVRSLVAEILKAEASKRGDGQKENINDIRAGEGAVSQHHGNRCARLTSLSTKALQLSTPRC